MRHRWVNQKRTHRQGVPGGFLWSPKRRSDNRMNPFYEFMREVAPGDRVYSYAFGEMRALGVATSFAYEAPKPAEFSEAASRHWDQIGWRVDVLFREIDTPLRPIDRIERLRPLLPEKYSPLRRDGRGQQSMYLTRVSSALADVLDDLIGNAAHVHDVEIDASAVWSNMSEIALWEEHLRRSIEEDRGLGSTDREQLILARRGQGRFRQGVMQIEDRCRVTRVSRPEHLRASHCKPWRDASNAERLDPFNSLMLTPSVDHLFDRGFISFEGDGRLLVSPRAHGASLRRMGVDTTKAVNVGEFHREQGHYLEYHRDMVFLKACV